MTGAPAFALVHGWLEILIEGSPRRRVQPDGRDVRFIAVVPQVDGVLVLSNPVGAGGRKHNLALVDGLGEVVWRAELPPGQQVESYATVTLDGSDELFASTWSGFLVALDWRTGKILSSDWGK
ncbi:hypothetical protein AB0N73_02460 [Microbacterium sp. NPDC089189]|uniref:hypothetical protein n=1 Tax=Microbacterium sp. NPDC089189 TaxID=3154972 RepID=UPI003445F19D